MAKKKKAKDVSDEVMATDGTATEGTAVAEQKPLTPYEKEEQYLKSLNSKQRKEYLRAKRSARRSEWLSEYWFIIILGIIAFIALAIVSIIVTFRLWEDKDDRNPSDDDNGDLVTTQYTDVDEFDF